MNNLLICITFEDQSGINAIKLHQTVKLLVYYSTFSFKLFKVMSVAL